MDTSAASYAPDAPAGRLLPRLREVGLHLLAAGLTGAILFAGQRLDLADLRVPLGYDHDSLLILPMVKETVERASPWTCDRLGAPGRQELHDFPVIDHLHFALIWLMGRVWPDPVVVFNLYHLLTYPLATLTALFVLRRLGLSAPAAVCGAVLYSFQPYHWLRGTAHYFLAAYYLVPLTLWVTLEVCRGRLPFFPATSSLPATSGSLPPCGGGLGWGGGAPHSPGGAPTQQAPTPHPNPPPQGGREPEVAGRGPEGGGRRGGGWRWTAAAVLIAALTSVAGAYYAFFACVLLAVAGVYGWAVGHGWRAAASAAGLVAVVVAGGLLAHAPAWAYKRAHGDNSAVTRRPAEDAEQYALKLAQLLLPVANHNPVGLGTVPLFEPAVLRAMYQAPQFKPLNESDWSPLGLVASCGFVGLLLACVLPGRKGGPVGACAALTLGGVLFATHGGAGAVFNLLVTGAVRCHNRISIYLAFLALFVACRFLDRLVPARWRWPAFLALIAFGIWDQTDTSWFPDLRRPDAGGSVVDARDETTRRWRADRRFFARVEELLPDGAVFTYPYLPFPEAPPVADRNSPGRIESYDMVRGYLHTRQLRWSFGAMKHRAVDGWQRAVAGAEPVPRMLERLVLGGFDALLVDKRGLNPARADALRAEIDRVLGHGSPRVTHPTGRLEVYDLRPYRAYLRANQGAAQLDELSRAEREAVSVLWLGQFTSFEPTGNEWRSHWGGPAGELVFVNPTDRPRTVELSCRLRTVFSAAATLRIDGGEVWADELTIAHRPDKGLPYRRTLVLPPGETRVKVTCRPAVTVLYTDSRRLLYTVLDFKLVEK